MSKIDFFLCSLVVSPRQGPASLPAELVNSAQREVPSYILFSLHCHSAQVRRLQELRRYIQEECDQLLLRKERLREEVSSSLHHPHATKQSTHHGKGHRVEEEEEVEEVMVRTVATQAPSSLLGVTHGPSLALSSLAHAYKVDGGCSTHFHSGVSSKELLAMSGL